MFKSRTRIFYDMGFFFDTVVENQKGREVLVRALVALIMWHRHFSVKVPDSTRECKNGYQDKLTKCWGEG